MPSVSIVMPSYNHAPFLALAIQSVLNQSFSDFELIIIDDASQDPSQRIIEQFQQRDTRIKIFFHKENVGIARTLNEGLHNALGEFVAFVDSDDLWDPRKLETQIKIINGDHNAIVWTEGEIIDQHGSPLGQKFTDFHGASHKRKDGNLFESLLLDNFILGSSVLIPKRLLDKTGFNHELIYLNDWLFFIELARKCLFRFIDVSLTSYRVHGNNTCRDQRGYTTDQIKISQILLCKYNHILSDETKSSLYFRLGIHLGKVGQQSKANLYILKSWLTDKKNPHARFYFTRRLKCKFPTLYKMLRSVWKKLQVRPRIEK